MLELVPAGNLSRLGKTMLAEAVVMPMECRGVVERIEKDKVWVRLLRSQRCDSCPGCGLLSKEPRNRVELELPSTRALKEGDEVVMTMPNRRLFLAFALVFGIPVLAMVTAYGMASLIVGLISPSSTGTVAVLAAAASGLLSFYLVVKGTNRSSMEPKITIYPKQGVNHVQAEEDPID